MQCIAKAFLKGERLKFPKSVPAGVLDEAFPWRMKRIPCRVTESAGFTLCCRHPKEQLPMHDSVHITPRKGKRLP